MALALVIGCSNGGDPASPPGADGDGSSSSSPADTGTDTGRSQPQEETGGRTSVDTSDTAEETFQPTTDTGTFAGAAFIFPPPVSATGASNLLLRAADDGFAGLTMGGVVATLADGWWTATVPVVAGSQQFALETPAGTLLDTVEVIGVSGPTSLGTGQDFGQVQTLEWDSAGGRLLVVDGYDSTVIGVDPSTGNRTVVSQGDWSMDSSIYISKWSLHASSDGALWGAGSDPASAIWSFIDTIARIDPATGDRTVASSSDVGAGPLLIGSVGAIASVPASDTLYAITEGDWLQYTPHLYEIDVATGDRTLLMASSNLDNRGGLAWHNGELLIVTYNALLAFDPSTGAIREVSGQNTGVGDPFGGVTGNVSVHDGTAFVKQSIITPMAIDLATGDRTHVATFGLQNHHLVDVSVDDDGLLWGFDENYGLVAVDPVSGELVAVSH